MKTWLKGAVIGAALGFFFFEIFLITIMTNYAFGGSDFAYMIMFLSLPSYYLISWISFGYVFNEPSSIASLITILISLLLNFFVIGSLLGYLIGVFFSRGSEDEKKVEEEAVIRK